MKRGRAAPQRKFECCYLKKGERLQDAAKKSQLYPLISMCVVF